MNDNRDLFLLDLFFEDDGVHYKGIVNTNNVEDEHIDLAKEKVEKYFSQTKDDDWSWEMDECLDIFVKALEDLGYKFLAFYPSGEIVL